MKSICNAGAVFGRWTVIEKAEDRKAICIVNVETRKRYIDQT